MQCYVGPINSTLPLSSSQNWIKYASYDCLVVSYLRRPVIDEWTFQQFKQAMIKMLLTDPLSVKSNTELEDTSADEVLSVKNGTYTRIRRLRFVHAKNNRTFSIF